MKTLVNNALIFATAAHAAKGQVRKYSGSPYIVHPIEVRKILLQYATNPVTEAQECAALLHDVVEDTDVKSDLIRDMFGEDVAVLVNWLTDTSKPEDGNRTVRKAIDRQHTSDAPSEAQTVKLADLISNSRDIVSSDPGFARTYLKEKELLLAVMKNADPGLMAEAQRVLTEGQNKLKG